MYTATVLLQIKKFTHMSGVYGKGRYIKAVINPPTDTSPPPYPKVPVFSGDGQSITISIPSTYWGGVSLTFQLPDPAYVLLGVAFKSDGGSVAQAEFPALSTSRDANGSQLTMLDACDDDGEEVFLDYLILVQQVSTGNIGAIDPDIDTEIIPE
ncbi:MAG: hypothetical protein NTV51_13750 [Verrucomicrobia bacterium]|nr:hypothetical protein [Verrucomicrobiota bacterium]